MDRLAGHVSAVLLRRAVRGSDTSIGMEEAPGVNTHIFVAGVVMAKLCGFPGKLGMDGSAVYPAYLDGKLDDIRRYCETDVMNTYLLYCRFQKMRGGLLEQEYAQEIALVKETLGNLATAEPHWQEYLSVWG